MKTPNKLVAAVILASAVLAAPAFAETPKEKFETRFAFNPNDPANEIYSDLTRTARRACEVPGMLSLRMSKSEQACIKEMVQDGVTKIGRPDVAAVHNSSFADAGTRG